jgi:hypothetical protein
MLNLGKLNEAQKELESSGGDGILLYASKTVPDGTEIDIRILPPGPDMGEIYYMSVNYVFIAGKKLFCREALGQECVIRNYFENILASKDQEAISLLKKLEGHRGFKREFWFPVLLLNCKFEGNSNKLESFEVDGDRARIFVCGKDLISKITALITSRQFSSDSEDLILDRVTGHNIVITRKGQKLKTEYNAFGWNYPLEMDAKYYENPVNLREELTNLMQSDDYSTAMLNHYFYGDAAPSDDARYDVENKTSHNSKRNNHFDDEDVEEDNVTTNRGGNVTTNRGGNANTINREENTSVNRAGTGHVNRTGGANATNNNRTGNGNVANNNRTTTGTGNVNRAGAGTGNVNRAGTSTSNRTNANNNVGSNSKTTKPSKNIVDDLNDLG